VVGPKLQGTFTWSGLLTQAGGGGVGGGGGRCIEMVYNLHSSLIFAVDCTLEVTF
jgi:hypothetical protein